MRVPDKKRKDEVERILYPPGIRWLVPPTFDEDGVQRTAGIDEFGQEHGDPVPTAPPVGLSVSQGDELHDALRKLFIKERAAWNAAIEREQFETEEEANDFLLEDELFPPGNEPWEDVHEFPAGDEGRSPTLAGEAPNGSAGPPEKPASQPSTSRVSEGSVSGSSVESSGQRPMSAADGSGTDTRAQGVEVRKV